MTAEPTRWLVVSGALELIASSLLGYVMLLPMQPWGARLRTRLPPPRALLGVHLDLLMLALMQLAAGVAMKMLPGPRDRWSAVLLIASGWLNVTPYIWRMAGVDAFALAGGPLQRVAATISLASTLALLAGWVSLVAGWL
jgi:hypothetical protein